MAHLDEQAIGEAHIVAEEIEEAATDVQSEIEEAHEQAARGDVAGAEARLQQLEARLSALEQATVDLRQAISERAEREHVHLMPGHLQTLSDALAEIESEEREPDRRPWIYRTVGRRR